MKNLRRCPRIILALGSGAILSGSSVTQVHETHAVVSLEVDFTLPAAGTYWVGGVPVASTSHPGNFYLQSNGAQGPVTPGNGNGKVANPGGGDGIGTLYPYQRELCLLGDRRSRALRHHVRNARRLRLAVSAATRPAGGGSGVKAGLIDSFPNFPAHPLSCRPRENQISNIINHTSNNPYPRKIPLRSRQTMSPRFI